MLTMFANPELSEFNIQQPNILKELITTKTTCAKHENNNVKLQEIIAK